MGRFQEFSPKWRDGEYKTDLVKLEDIKKVPIAAFLAENDTTCTVKNTKKELARISSKVENILVEGEQATHEYFAFSTTISNEWFMEHLIKQLQPGDDSAKYSDNPAVEKAVAEWTLVKDLSEFANYSAMKSNLALAGASLSWALHSGLNALRYRSSSTYYDFAKIGDDSNYYKTGDLIGLYGGTALGGTLTLTSLLAAFGMAAHINGLAWFYIMAFLAPILNLVTRGFRSLAYDKAYTHTQGTDTAKAASGATVITACWNDAITDTVISTGLLITVYANLW